MRYTINRMQYTCIVLTALLLFQSCRVYKKVPVTINEAVTSEKRIKIKTLDGNKLKFKRVVIVDGNYYGIKKVNGKLEKIPIDLNTIDTVREHNTTLSIIYGVTIAATIALYISYGIVLTAWAN